MLNKKFKKVISTLTMFATVVCLSGVSMLAPLSAKADSTIVDGDIIHSNATNSDGTPALSSTDVYIVKIVGNKMFKRLVLNPNIFASYGHLKWSNLKTVSQATEDSYKTSSLVRVDGDSKVYALTPVAGGDTGAKSWVNVTADQFVNGANSDSDSIYTINSVDSAAYSVKADITTVAQLKAFYFDGTLPAGAVSGDLTASLAASTPESTNVPNGSLVDFTSVNLAAGSQDVAINSITVSANGLGADSAFTNIALYLDGSKIGTSKTSINSSRQATFNFSSPVAISANSSKTLTIKASVSASSSYVLGIKSATDIVTAGGTVGGSFPIWGNQMSSVANASIGTVTLSSVNSTPAPSENFGEQNVLLAGFNLQASSGEADLLQSIRLKNGGTNTAGILSNLKLVIDGDAAADGTYDSSTGYVNFNIDGNYKIKKASTVSVEVYGDLGTANVGNTIALYIKSVDDVAFVGETYGFGVQIDGTSYGLLNAATDGIVVTLATGDVTISMDKVATPDKDVKKGATGVVLGTFSITSNGENATISQIASGGANFQIKGTTLAADKISNVVMVDTSTGATYDVAAVRASDTVWNLTMSDEISLVKGVKKTFEIRADLADTIASDSTLKVYIAKNAISITGDESDAPISNITPSSLTSATATVKAASLDWTTSSLSAKHVVPGATDVSIYQASLEAGTVSDVKLSTVTLTAHDIPGATDDFNDNNISKIDLYLNGKLIKSVSNQIVESTNAAKGYITFNSLITTDSANVIKAGTTVTLEAKATFASSLTNVASFSLTCAATGSVVARDASDNTTFTITLENATTGSRTVTASTQGTMKVELLTTNSKADNDSLVLAGTSSPSDKYLGELKFTTANEAVNLTELRLIDGGSATSSDIAEVDLVDASGVVKASKIPSANGDVTFTNMNLTLPADQATSLFISVKFRGMNVDGDASSMATQGDAVVYHISGAANGIVAKGADSQLPITLVTNPGGNVDAGEWSAVGVTSKTATVTGAILNSVTNALSDGTLMGGSSKIIGKYTLVFDNGSNRTATNDELKAILDNLTITVSKSSAVVLTAVKVQIDGTSTKVAADTLNTLGNASSTGSAVWNAGTLSNATTGLTDGGKVDGSVTIVVTADVATTAAVGEYVQTSIADTDAVKYIGDGVAGDAVLAHNLLSTTEVDGGTLSE
jgi:hypothetical protein